MKINIVVCDDENIALKINCTYIEELTKKYRIDANILGFFSGEKLLEHMENNVIDIPIMKTVIIPRITLSSTRKCVL